MRPARWPRADTTWSRVPHPVAWALVLAVAALVLAPLVSLVHIAFQGDAEYWSHLAQYVIPAATRDTALLLAGVAGVTTIVGLGTAWTVTFFSFPGRTLLTWLLPLPLAIPTYIGAYVYADLLDALGPLQAALRAVSPWALSAQHRLPEIRSLPGAVFVFGFVLYPYVYLSARAMFQTQPAVFAEAARTLGATPWWVASRITFPLARPALAVGLALALLETLNDIGASEYLGVRTLTLSIFTTWLNGGSLPGAAQIALLMLSVVVALIALERYGRRREQVLAAVQDAAAADRIRLSGARRWIAAGACWLPVLFGFLIPACFLVRETVVRGLLVGFDPALVRHASNSMLLAAAATVVTLTLGAGVVLAARVARSRRLHTIVGAAGLGYAVPGTVLALGLLAPLVATDAMLNWASLNLTGARLGLVLTGSGAAVVLAYAIRFLAIPTGFTQAGLARVPSEFDDVARLLGAKPRRVVRMIDLPLVRPALASAALLVFVDCLKELPATLLLRPMNVETLSTYTYQFATRGSFEEGALAALLIVAVGILPVIYVVRYAEGSPSPARVAPIMG
jgi:iron(III) transport system permease protein